MILLINIEVNFGTICTIFLLIKVEIFTISPSHLKILISHAVGPKIIGIGSKSAQQSLQVLSPPARRMPTSSGP